MTKEDKIKEAYGDRYEELKSDINIDGVFVGCTLRISDEEFKEWSFVAKTDGMNGGKSISGSRPKLLSGIENNNGWIKIESENDLPKEYNNYWCITFSGDTKILRYDPEFKEWYYECNTGLSFNVTHYQSIEKPKPPIY